MLAALALPAWRLPAGGLELGEPSSGPRALSRREPSPDAAARLRGAARTLRGAARTLRGGLRAFAQLLLIGGAFAQLLLAEPRLGARKLARAPQKLARAAKGPLLSCYSSAGLAQLLLVGPRLG